MNVVYSTRTRCHREWSRRIAACAFVAALVVRVVYTVEQRGREMVQPGDSSWGIVDPGGPLDEGGGLYDRKWPVGTVRGYLGGGPSDIGP